MARKAPDVRRIEFVETAQQLFYTKGYESTSVNDLINEVGVSKGAFYHHFASKQAVLEAVIDELVAQTREIMQPILDNPTLTAIEKFNRMVRNVNSSKIEQRGQMLALVRVLYSDDNVLLQRKLNNATMRHSAPVLAQIVEQGIAEKVFDLEAGVPLLDTAEFIFAILQSASDTMIRFVLDSDRPANAAAIAATKYTAAQKTIERILRAPSGSLSPIDQESIGLWFA